MSRPLTNSLRPVVKWAGGKSKLVERLAEHMPDRIGTYVEPFCGGAALFFHLAGHERIKFDRAILTDKNEHLIACYRAIQSEVDRLIGRLSDLAADYERRDEDGRRDLFYRIRDKAKPRSDVERGARLLFLNKTCFNGLWRENAAGKNNVPFGRYERPRILDAPLLKAAHRALQSAEVIVADYSEPTKRLKSGDFVYFDPPYIPVSKTANFTAYARSGFGVDDQKRLRRLLAELRARNVKAMLSNSCTPEIQDFYAEFSDRLVVPMARSINSNPSKRGVVDELIVYNWPVGDARKAAS